MQKILKEKVTGVFGIIIILLAFSLVFGESEIYNEKKNEYLSAQDEKAELVIKNIPLKGQKEFHKLSDEEKFLYCSVMQDSNDCKAGQPEISKTKILSSEIIEKYKYYFEIFKSKDFSESYKAEIKRELFGGGK